ncbi:MAG: hypothetical protein QOD99_2164 [Chthoniobacter sp.]|nr:hypothetical protein [Chthoniobacter sp.]
MQVLRNHRQIQQKKMKVTKRELRNLCFLRCLLFSIWRPVSAALRFVAGIICVGEERFHFLPKKRIAGAGSLHKGRSPGRVITIDGLGQDRFYLLPAFWSHLMGQECEGLNDWLGKKPKVSRDAPSRETSAANFEGALLL